jgi:hypothetical protein
MEVSGQLHATAALPIGKETNLLQVWVGLRAGLDTVSKRRIPSPRRESNPDHPIFHPVASRYTDWAIPAHI